MQEYYTSATTKFGRILYRGYAVDESGVRIRLHGRLAYKPTLYVECKDQESEFKSLIGNKPLQAKKFESMTEAKDFINDYEDAMPIYGYAPSRMNYNFLIENFPNVMELGVDDICVGSVDIETTTEHGKIDTVNTPEEITLITYQNIKTKKLVTWGSKPSSKPNYVLCDNEARVLTHFVAHVMRDDPDVLTGWNLAKFDIPYIINRGKMIIGEPAINKLSPFHEITVKEEMVMGKSVQKFTITGRSILDMLELYLKFTFVKRANNRLDTISKIELGAGKLVNPFNTFREFYSGICDIHEEPAPDDHILRHMAYKRTQMRSEGKELTPDYIRLDGIIKQRSWDLFIEYNQVDTVRVSELEDKLGLIALAMGIAYKAKINFTDVFGPVKIWECMIMGKLYTENTFVETKRISNSSGGIVGAYVHQPKPGFYDWLVSIDAEALYPSIAISCNMSPETLLGMNLDCSEAALMAGADFSGEDYTIAANGAMFSKDVQGIIPRLMQELKDSRSLSKKQMLEAKQQYIDTKDEKYKKLSVIKGTSQLAVKVLNNSGYGAISQSGFMFFDNRIAEGITMTGRYIIQYVSRHFNKRLNDYFKTDDFNYIVYMDTDSSFFTLGNIVKKHYAGKTDAEIVTALDDLMENHLRALINEATDHIAKSQNYYKNMIFFKREKICSSGFWCAPKKYALKVYDNEGVRYAEPEYAITGIEVVRSSTPEIARSALRECVTLLINKDIDRLRELVVETKTKFLAAKTEEIAFPRGVNNLLAYSDDDTIYTKGTPIAVRAALMHNHMVDKLDLENEYNPIEEGDKILFLYLKLPNPLKENVVAFVDKLPNEFKLEQYVDKELQFEKVFIAPLQGMLTAVSWELEEKATLDEFFE